MLDLLADKAELPEHVEEAEEQRKYELSLPVIEISFRILARLGRAVILHAEKSCHRERKLAAVKKITRAARPEAEAL